MPERRRSKTLKLTDHAGTAVRGDRYLTVAELYRTYPLEPCREPSRVEGRLVHVRGRVDWNNVFDKRSHPRLPYEKFKIVDPDGGKSVEIWTVAVDNGPIFDELRRNASPGRQVLVSGRLVTFDMSLMNDCRKGVKVELSTVADVHFE